MRHSSFCSVRHYYFSSSICQCSSIELKVSLFYLIKYHLRIESKTLFSILLQGSLWSCKSRGLSVRMFKSSCKHDATKPLSLSLIVPHQILHCHNSSSLTSQARHVTAVNYPQSSVLALWFLDAGVADTDLPNSWLGATPAAGGHVQHTNYRPIVSLSIMVYVVLIVPMLAHCCFKGSLHHLLCQLFYWASMFLRLATLCAFVLLLAIV